MKEFRNTGYFVFENGEVLGKWKKLKPTTTPYGYKSVCLYYGGKTKTFLVHRMVAELYIDNTDNKTEVNHIDGNKLNNHFSNLEWVTKKENIQHFLTKISKRGIGEHPNSKLKFDDMLWIHEQITNGNIYQKDIAKKFNVHITTIQRALKTIQNQTKEIR